MNPIQKLLINNLKKRWSMLERRWSMLERRWSMLERTIVVKKSGRFILYTYLK